MRPLIGIPPCLDERGRWRRGRDYHYIDCAYARAVDAAGAVPVYVPDLEHPEHVLAKLDGLLLPGGDDFPPDRPYPDSVAFDVAPARQRAGDRALLEAALARELPVLGICYGMQLLALLAGGALHFDLSSDLPDASPHQLDSDARHMIEVAPGSRLAAALRHPRPLVNSRHHQAVREPGRATVSARASDGVIEAIELPEARFALGVQWHPETLDPAHKAQLFGAFVAACAERSAGGAQPGRPY